MCANKCSFEFAGLYRCLCIQQNIIQNIIGNTYFETARINAQGSFNKSNVITDRSSILERWAMALLCTGCNTRYGKRINNTVHNIHVDKSQTSLCLYTFSSLQHIRQHISNRGKNEIVCIVRRGLCGDSVKPRGSCPMPSSALKLASVLNRYHE